MVRRFWKQLNPNPFLHYNSPYMEFFIYFRKLKHTFGAVDQDEPPQGYKQPIELPREQPSPPPTHVREPSPPRREPSPPRRQPSPPRHEPSPPRREPSPPRREPSPTPQVPSEQPQRRSLLAENLPQRQPDSDDEQNDDDDWGEDGKFSSTITTLNTLMCIWYWDTQNH